MHDGGLPRWFGLCTGTQKITPSVPGLSDTLGPSDIEKLVHSPYQHPLRIMSSKENACNGFPRTCHELSTLFADSLTSTLLEWLGYATGFSVLARLHSHIQLMLESVLNLYYSAVMMLEVMYETSLTSKRSSDKPGTTIATVFTCNRRRKSACWTKLWQVFPKSVSKQFLVRISLISVQTVLMCNDLLLWFGGGNPSDSPRRSSWTSPRTWMVPCQGWSSQNLISSKKL